MAPVRGQGGVGENKRSIFRHVDFEMPRGLLS